MLKFFANLPPCAIGLEACRGAHHRAREPIRLGHGARLRPPQQVKARRSAPASLVGAGSQARVETNKHGTADAGARPEAVQRPSMRFVSVKSATLMFQRVRDQLIDPRTATRKPVGLWSVDGVERARRTRQA
jgi:transposase